MTDGVHKRSILIAGHATSISLEDVFWDELKRIAERQGQPVNDLITEIDEARTTNLSSAVRVFVLNDIKTNPPSN